MDEKGWKHNNKTYRKKSRLINEKENYGRPDAQSSVRKPSLKQSSFLRNAANKDIDSESES